MRSVKLSVVSPVYKADDCIEELYQRLTSTLSNITSDYEIILVEDRGGDRSWEIIQCIALKDKKVKAIKLSKNFGQHKAITAGLHYARGENVVVMDCDLQDAPEEIENLYKKIKEGSDIVMGRRLERQDSFLKCFVSTSFYKIYSYCVGIKMDHTVANFGIYSKRVIDSFLKISEQHRFFPITIKWLGFDCVYIDVVHAKRFRGKSSYSIYKLIKHAVDNIISNSSLPLLAICNIGLVLSVFSFLYAIHLSINWYFFGISSAGWTSLMVFLNFIGGIIISSIGVVGLYVRKIFEEVKGRPLYIVDQVINIE